MKNSPSDDPLLLVSTRLGVGVSDERWLRHRLLLFRAVTAPSMRAQTNQDFVWVIFLGAIAPTWFKAELEEITAGIGNKVILEQGRQRMDVVNQLVKQFSRSGIVLATIDDDDAWHRDYVAETLRYVRLEWSDGNFSAVLTFDFGFFWVPQDILAFPRFDETYKPVMIHRQLRMYRKPSGFHSMSAAVAVRGDTLPRDAFSVHGSHGRKLAEGGFQRRVILNQTAMWLYVRHRHTHSSTGRIAGPSIDFSDDLLSGLFGIDVAGLETYRELAPSFGYAEKKTLMGDMVQGRELVRELTVQSPAASQLVPYRPWLGLIVIGVDGVLSFPSLTERNFDSVLLKDVWGTKGILQVPYPVGGNPQVTPSEWRPAEYAVGRLSCSDPHRGTDFLSTTWAPVLDMRHPHPALRFENG